MNQDDLQNKSISEMSDEELYELLKQNRSNRRKQPEKPAKKQKASGGKKKSDGMKEILKNLSPEEQQKLLNDLGGSGND